MKPIVIVLTMLATPLFASESLPKAKLVPLDNMNAPENTAVLEEILTDTISKFIYVSRDCSKPIDPKKIEQLAQMKALSEGYPNIDGVNWDKIKRNAHIKYGELKISSPEGELCQQYNEAFKDVYKWVKENK